MPCVRERYLETESYWLDLRTGPLLPYTPVRMLRAGNGAAGLAAAGEPDAKVRGGSSGSVWHCALCGQCNLSGETCEACGVARRFLDDPPLNIPFPPRLTQLPSFWLSVVWAVAAAGGLFALASPGIRESVPLPLLLTELVFAAAAAGSSLFTALWERIFNEVTLTAPPHAATDTEFTAELRLVPYRQTENVSVTLSLMDRYFVNAGDGDQAKTRYLSSQGVLVRGRLPGRRATTLSAPFMAPFPFTQHASGHSDLLADVFSLLSFVLPALRFSANNLREHGGYYVEARVRVGFLSRKFHRRVITYAVGKTVHVG